jgi:hypothetical protein
MTDTTTAVAAVDQNRTRTGESYFGTRYRERCINSQRDCQAQLFLREQRGTEQYTCKVIKVPLQGLTTIQMYSRAVDSGQ